MTTNNKQKKTFESRKHRGVSPILATVILLGVTTVGGGLTFAVMSQGVDTAGSSNAIQIENVQAVKGTDHADATATIKNIGTKNWVKLEMTVAKSELSEPLLYESLHENVQGCVDMNTCKDDFGASGGRDNPLRAQWIASLDKTGGATDEADPGEGIAVGRKLVFDKKDDLRTVTILNGTAVAPLFGGQNPAGATTVSAKMTSAGITACAPSSSGVDCGAQFKALDGSVKGQIKCKSNSDDAIAATCDVFTHQSIVGNPVQPGESKYFYADAFTKTVKGLNNLTVTEGDSLVVNIVAEADDGSNTRVQTIMKVVGI